MIARAIAVVLSILLATSAASAQDEGFGLSRYRPPPGANDGLTLQRPMTAGPWGWTGKLVIDYAHAPLVLSQSDGMERGDEIGPIVEHALVAHASFALGLGERLQVSLGVPATLVQRGDGPDAMGFDTSSVEGASLGDLGLGFAARLVGSTETPSEGFDPQVGVAATALLPSGSQDKLAGDGGFGLRADALLALASVGITPIVNLGVAYRPRRTFVDAEIGTELTFGAGAHVPVGHTARFEAELRGATTFADFFGATSTPMELVVGAQLDLGDSAFVGIGIGAGITGGVGVPDFRGLLSLGYGVEGGATTGGDVATDSDGDGVPDGDDACPEEAGEGGDGCPTGDATGDRDGDGVPDGDDFCPDQGETPNMFQDEDGCPDGVTRTETALEVSPALLFDSESSELSDEAEQLLGLVAEAMNSASDVQMFQIEGHASSDEGNDRRALRLSESRAEAVVAWLTSEGGVDEARLSALGVGADRPRNADTPADNRRVEIQIVNF